MSEPRVVHCKTNTGTERTIYIGRPSIWGNPFSHKEDTLAMQPAESPEHAVSLYEWWIHLPDQSALLARVSELRGKNLACWCKTKKNPDAPCHGDVLLRIANTPIGE